MSDEPKPDPTPPTNAPAQPNAAARAEKSPRDRTREILAELGIEVKKGAGEGFIMPARSRPKE